MLCFKRSGDVSIETIFYTQLGSILGFIVALFVLYRVLVSQKDSTIQLLKEKIGFLETKLNAAKANTPDMLVKALADRIKILEEELTRLKKDEVSNQELIGQKELELNSVREEAEELSKSISAARELMEEFICPYCGSPMAERAYHIESVEDSRGRDIDIDHEVVTYECGLSVVDGSEESPCKGNYPRQPSIILKHNT